jgi:hypothetical protein
MKPETIEQLKKAIWSYLRAALAAVGALVLAGIEDPGTITVSALIAGALGPLVRALDPNDDAYGIGASIGKAYETAKADEPLFDDDSFEDDIVTDPRDQP